MKDWKGSSLKSNLSNAFKEKKTRYRELHYLIMPNI